MMGLASAIDSRARSAVRTRCAFRILVRIAMIDSSRWVNVPSMALPYWLF